MQQLFSRRSSTCSAKLSGGDEYSFQTFATSASGFELIARLPYHFSWGQIHSFLMQHSTNFSFAVCADIEGGGTEPNATFCTATGLPLANIGTATFSLSSSTGFQNGGEVNLIRKRVHKYVDFSS